MRAASIFTKLWSHLKSLWSSGKYFALPSMSKTVSKAPINEVSGRSKTRTGDSRETLGEPGRICITQQNDKAVEEETESTKPENISHQTSLDAAEPKHGNSHPDDDDLQDDKKKYLTKAGTYTVPSAPSVCGNNEVSGTPQSQEYEPRQIAGRRGRQCNIRSPVRQPTTVVRPELVCIEEATSGCWNIVLKASKEFQIVKVCLNGESLEFTGKQCPIPSLRGVLTIFYQDGKKYLIPLFDGSPLIFKQRKNWEGEGRRVKKITSGYFIFVAPGDWKRIGHVPVEPVGCSDQAFRAHYFHRDASMSDEDTLYFREWHVPESSGIELVGEHVFDNSDEGMLFVGDPPEIKFPQKYKSARIGSEEANGWGRNFQPNKQTLSSVLARREGRYFIRVYDEVNGMLDSTAFRYARSLKRINLDQSEYNQGTEIAPTREGYQPIEIQLVGVDGSILRPILPAQSKQRIGSSGAIKIPANPDADRVSCRLGAIEQNVEIILEMPRSWWRLEERDVDPGSWCDTPLIMTREEFKNHGYQQATLSVLSRRETQIRAGFNDKQDLPFKRTAEESIITIPLFYFVECEQIRAILNQDAHFNVEWSQWIVPLIVVSADPAPKIISFCAKEESIDSGQESTLEWRTQDSDDAQIEIKPSVGAVDASGQSTIRPIETTVYTLTLKVNGVVSASQSITVTVSSHQTASGKPTCCVMSVGGGWRVGKGFSRREIEEVGLALKEAVDRSIPIDRRRQTMHQINIQELRRMRDVEYRN